MDRERQQACRRDRAERRDRQVLRETRIEDQPHIGAEGEIFAVGEIGDPMDPEHQGRANTRQRQYRAGDDAIEDELRQLVQTRLHCLLNRGAIDASTAGI